MNICELTQAEYLALLDKQRDPAKRNAMKQFAHAAMYGRPDAKVYLPMEFVEELDAQRPPL